MNDAGMPGCDSPYPDQVRDFLRAVESALRHGRPTPEPPPDLLARLGSSDTERLRKTLRLYETFHARRCGGDPPRPGGEAASSPFPSVPGYRVIEVAGTGTFATVYRAEDLNHHNRPVALKLLHEHLGDDALRRFRREAEILAKLDHPNVVGLLTAGSADGRPFLVMRFIDGESLAQRIWDGQARKYHPQDPRWSAGLIATVARAVHAAHEPMPDQDRHGVVHRDLKPENILLDRAGTPYVTDFGLARFLDDVPGQSRSAGFAGTRPYMAPEQIDPIRFGPLGRAADVYALGAVLYLLLTGRSPFTGATPADLLRQILADSPDSPRRLRSGVPRDLETIVLKCLEKEPARRYASAAALADDLDRYCRGEPITARPVSPLGRGWRLARRRPVVAALLAGLLLTVSAGVAGVVWQWRLAEAARGETEITLYFSRIGQAELAWRSNDVDRADQLLDACVPRIGRADPRGWEWHYLKRLCHADLFTLRGHSAWVNGVAYSPDGRLIASAGGNHYESGVPGEVVLWDAATGQLVRSLPGLELAAYGVAFSPDGRRLAVAEGDRNDPKVPGVISIWDVGTGQPLARWRGHTSRVWGVAFSPDGRRLASASADLTVKVWDAESARELLTLPGHTKQVMSVAFSPDGTRLASVGDDGLVKIWNATTGHLFHTWPGGDCVAYHPSTPRVAAASDDGTIRVWDADTGREVQTLRGHAGLVVGLAFSPDGTRLASASTDTTVRVWDLESGAERLTLRGHTWVARGVAFSPDGTRLASAGQDQTVKVWDITRDSRVLTFPAGKDYFLVALAFGPDGTSLASVDYSGRLRLCDPATGSPRAAHPVAMRSQHIWPIVDAAFSTDGRCFAGVSADDDRVVKVWDVATGRERLVLRGHTMPVYSVAFSPDGTRLATAAADDPRFGGPGQVKVWDAATGRELLSFHAHARPVIGLTFRPDGRRLATCSHDGTVKVWDVADGRELLTLAGHQDAVTSVTFSPDGRLASAGYRDRTVRIWDAATGRELHTLQGPLQLTHLAYSPDGRRLAAASTDVVKLWDADTGHEALTLRGNAPHRRDDLAFNARVAFSPDGRRLASTNWDHSINVWDAGGGIGPAAFTPAADRSVGVVPAGAIPVPPDGR